MKKILVAAAMLLLCTGHSFAAMEWIDVTNMWLANPRFQENDNTGWTIDANSISNAVSYNAQEFWYGAWNISQSLALPQGHYRLSCNAYHRNGKNSNSAVRNWQTTPTTSVLYAGAASTPVKSVYSESLSENYNYGCWEYSPSGAWTQEEVRYYPNNMESASYCFSQGMYRNELEFDVVEGTTTLGIMNTTSAADNWCIMSNFRLEYYGESVPITKISVGSTSIFMSVGEERTLTPKITPTNATNQVLTWDSSNTDVAIVDQNGTVTGVAPGTAYINARATDGSGKKGQCLVNVSYNVTGQAKLIINEIMVGNIDQHVDPSMNYGGWIELYNPTSTSVTLTGCWISDDPTNPRKAHISQPMAIDKKGYLCLWFDHHDCYTLTQLDMKLDSKGGTIYFYNEGGKLLAQQQYPAAVPRCSYARKAVDSEEWGMTSTPSPEASNEGASYADVRLEAPQVDQDSQIFGTSLTVCVNIPEGATLRYTTDGTTPTLTNGEESLDGLFYPDYTTTYRFALFQDGYLPSPVVTRTYIYQERDFPLPVMSVVTDPKHLYSDDMGVFVRGYNGRPGNGQSQPCNWNMDWERPINFEYLVDNRMVVNQEAYLERCGGWSRAWTPYSFKVKANKIFDGESYLPYNFFSEKPYLKHKSLQVRNGGNDNGCRLKDPALQEIVLRSGIDIDCQGYQPVMHYINGEYAGVINVREPNNRHFVYANYGLDDDEIDQFEMSPDSGYVQKCGTYESLQRWYNLSLNASDPMAYESIKDMVDIDEFINYMAVEFYLGGTDWPQNNVKAFKPITEGGKFRFVLFDLDGTFATSSPFTSFSNKQYYTFDALYGNKKDKIVTGSHIQKEIELVTIFLGMLQNDEFRKQFIDTYCLVAGSVFEPSRCREIINELAARVNPVQPGWNYVYGWSSDANNTASTLISNLSSGRQRNMISALKSFLQTDLGAKTAQSVMLSTNIPEARLLVNELPVPTNAFSGFLFAPVTLKAQAPAGYRFAGWKAVDGTLGAKTLLPRQSTWAYYDKGSLDDSDWTALSFNDNYWEQAAAPLAYGKAPAPNTLQSNRSCYYFRKEITLTKTPLPDDKITLDFTVDDGCIVYVNGEEAGRYNMPYGDIYYSDFATEYAHDNPDAGTMSIDPSLFRTGKNVIAVEVHNNSTTSTDIYWDAALIHSTNEASGQYVAYDEEMDLPNAASINLQACYEPLTAEEMMAEGLSQTPIVINEVSAGNSVNIDDYFKKNDWIELYNTTNHDIDLRGMYLTDKSTKPMKYEIGAGDTDLSASNASRYIIKAHSYKVIWCSQSEDKGLELHANFKLNNEDGKMVRIQSADGTWADSLVYCAHNGDQSVGRYPDGGSQTYLMTRPTILAPNAMNTYTQEWQYVAPDDPEETGVLASRSGAMSIAYQSERILVKSEENEQVTLCIYTPAGALVAMHRLHLEGGHAATSVASLPAGVYIARAKDSEGNECATKFMKN